MHSCEPILHNTCDVISYQFSNTWWTLHHCTILECACVVVGKYRFTLVYGYHTSRSIRSMCYFMSFRFWLLWYIELTSIFHAQCSSTVHTQYELVHSILYFCPGLIHFFMITYSLNYLLNTYFLMGILKVSIIKYE